VAIRRCVDLEIGEQKRPPRRRESHARYSRHVLVAVKGNPHAARSAHAWRPGNFTKFLDESGGSPPPEIVAGGEMG